MIYMNESDERKGPNERVRTVYYISDGTGLSAEALGHSLMTQFQKIPFQSHTLPYIDTEEKAKQAVKRINETTLAHIGADRSHCRPIVFSTIVKPSIRDIITESKAFVIDFFQAFIGQLEQELHVSSSPVVGLSHAVKDVEQYNSRIEAVHFALQCDDGVYPQGYQTADIILLGVSRSGKTPTCLYMALQFGIRAANYPLTEETLHAFHLPTDLEPYRSRLLGLTIASDRLHTLRSKRRPNSPYSALEQCQMEVRQAESLFNKEKIPFLNSTHLSVEELSTHILTMTGLRRSFD